MVLQGGPPGVRRLLEVRRQDKARCPYGETEAGGQGPHPALLDPRGDRAAREGQNLAGTDRHLPPRADVLHRQPVEAGCRALRPEQLDPEETYFREAKGRTVAPAQEREERRSQNPGV